MTELPGIDAASVSDSSCGTEIMQMSTVLPNKAWSTDTIQITNDSEIDRDMKPRPRIPVGLVP